MALACGASLSVLAIAAEAGAQPTDPPPKTVEQLVVTAPRQEQAARVVQFEAPNLVSVRAIETIRKYPDYNAAEALGRMPAISLSSDTGEGRFVQIRGIDANLDGATYGGVPLLNTFPGGTESGGGGRAVEFDTIPVGAVDGIIVTYTTLPDHEAEGLGGSIELSPRTAAHVDKPFIEGTVGWGWEPLHDHTGPFEGDIAFGGRFGFDNGRFVFQNGQTRDLGGFFSNPAPFSFVFYGSREDDRRAVDDQEASYIDDGLAPSKAISQYDLRYYNYHRRRFSYGGDIEFQPNDEHGWYLRGDVAGYKEAQHKNFLLLENLGAVEDPMTGQIPVDPNDPNGFLVTTTPAITETDEQETHRNSIFVVGGHDNFGATLIDYRAAYSRATFYQTPNYGAEFDAVCATADGSCPLAYDNSANNGDFPKFNFEGFNVFDPTQYSLASASNSQERDVDEEYSGALNVQFAPHFFNDDDRIKFGGEVRLRHKTVTHYDESYSPPGISLAHPGYSSPGHLYYDNHYPTGPIIDQIAVQDLLNGPMGGSSGAVYCFSCYITAQENIYAGYGEYTGQFGKLGVLAGVRVEATRATYGGYVQATDASGNVTNSLLLRNADYVDAFPTIQLRYQIQPNFLARLTWSTGIARPGFNQNTTAASVDHTASPIAISRGNPDLKPTYGEMFDFSLEYYLANGGIIEFAAFDKQFTNYIVPRVQNGVTTDSLAPGQLANVTTYENVPSGYARGVTIDYHQKYSWLPYPFDGLGIEGNFTWVDSRILEYTAAQTGTVDEYGPLPGTSQITWNLAGFYEAHGFEARLAAEYVGHSLFGLSGNGSTSGDKSLDTIQDDRLTLDFTSGYRINGNFTVFVEARNLLNTPLRYYEGSPNRPIQREFYDPTYQAGVRFKF
ncbi:MAG TPA: TonB-dependent receptor [Caulobacteraceae bacterium]|nr:TonB-dependent receptor [Caulobacteraceae bacterium]